MDESSEPPDAFLDLFLAHRSGTERSPLHLSLYEPSNLLARLWGLSTGYWSRTKCRDRRCGLQCWRLGRS